MRSLNAATQFELQQVISHLDQAIYNHHQWLNSLIRSLICHLPGDNNDILPDAHTRCRFGQWYYGDSPEIIQQHPGFMSIGNTHKRMHEFARNLLQKAIASEAITGLEYDYFAIALEQLRIEMSNLKNELEYLIYNRDPLTPYSAVKSRIKLPVWFTQAV